MNEKPIHVLIVDDHPVVRMGLKTMLESEDDIAVVGMAGSAVEALQLIEETNPTVVLMDLRMPGMDGTDAIAEMRRIWPAVRILVLTNYQEDEYVSKAIQAGAMGYLLKNTPQNEIVTAVRTLAKNGLCIPEEISRRLLSVLGRDKLSERELEVLALVARGFSNKEIAQKLFISDKTARNHVTSCLIKLDANDRTEAATKAIKRGLIRIDD
jgi:DNA-binding NarL/FixJ family response regulator